jgi:hypothetical protein
VNAPPGGAPKPPPGLWAEMEAAGAAGDDYRLAIARAAYLTWLHEQDIEGHPDPFHGHAPTEVDDDSELI